MEAWQSGRMRRTRNAVGPKGPRGFESSRFRQLGNEVIGSPVFDPEGLRPEWATRARQPFFGEISSRFACPPKPRRRREFSNAKSGLFLNALRKSKLFDIITLKVYHT